MQENKVYLKQSIKDWLHWFWDIWDKHISLRLSWKPSFLLEQYKKKHWDKEWEARYRELLLMLKDIWDNNKSPFVVYINKRK